MTSFSDLLLIPELEENQNDRHITDNNQIKYFERATQRPLPNSSIGAGPWELTSDEFLRNFAFKASGASGNFDIVTLGETGSNNTQRIFAVINADTTYTATVKSDAAGTTVVLPPKATAIISQDHDDLTILARWSTDNGEALPYDVGFFVSGQPADGATVMILVATRAFTLADDFAGSKYHNGANPTATAVFDVQKNESSIGSISVNTSGVATFSTTGGGVSMAIGDRLKVAAPSPQDATLGDVAVLFRGMRA